MSCDCGFVAPEGCTCGFDVTTTVSFAKVAAAADSRKATHVIDPREDNIASIGTGLLVEAPAVLRTRPHARLYNSAAVLMGDGVETLFSFDTAQINDGSMVAAVPATEIVASEPGLYLVSASMQWGGHADGTRAVWIVVNGSAKVAGNIFWTLNAELFTTAVSAIVRLNEFDSVGVMVETKAVSLQIQAANATTSNQKATLACAYLGGF